MNWQQLRQLHRNSHAEYYDPPNASEYGAFAGMGYFNEDHTTAHLQDLAIAVQGLSSPRILDVGAGTGSFTTVLQRIPGAHVTALEPSPAMIACLRDKPELHEVRVVLGGCDSRDDQSLFARDSFDLIACRNVVNGLFDPLVAFGNWLHWLRPGGVVVVLDATFGRDAWKGKLEALVDLLPLSCTQSLATITYLLEHTGFMIEHVGWMESVNQLPSTRTKRYWVLGKKPQ